MLALATTSLRPQAVLQLPALRLFPRQPPDRTCLLSPPAEVGDGVALPLPLDADAVAAAVELINTACHRHRDASGALTALVRGKRTRTDGEREGGGTGQRVLIVGSGFAGGHWQGQRKRAMMEGLYRVPAERPECDEVDGAVTPAVFLNEFVFRSRPAIFRGAARHWPALAAWTNDFLRYTSSASSSRARLCARAAHSLIARDAPSPGPS